MTRQANPILDAVMIFLGFVLLAAILLACGCKPREQEAVDTPSVTTADTPPALGPTPAIEPYFPPPLDQSPAWVAPPDQVAPVGDAAVAWWVAVLHSEPVEWLASNLVMLFFVGGVGWLLKKIVQSQAQKDSVDTAMKSIAAGVNESFHTYTQAAKAASADGKLTVDEQREARRLALEYAKTAAAEKGVDLVKTLGARFIPSLIDQAVKEAKKKADPDPAAG